MTDLTGDAVRPAAFSSAFSAGVARAQSTAGAPSSLTGAELRASLAALPLVNVRRGYRPEAVERLVERVAEELVRRARGEAPLLRAGDVHPDGFAMSRPGYALEPTRALLAAAAEALKA